ncbi:MAG: CBS domain-containing protein, partial [Roseburia sp.]|nr:CBS domain-containing protein [Roseburia sp.]
VDFIPETRNINVLFAMMQNAKSHMTIVVDEYGQTSGIVTMEDILEEIVGNIEDEHDEEQQMIVRLQDGSFRMDGMAEFEDVLEALDIGEEVAKEDDFETLNGFLISLIDKIPNEDEVFSTTAYGYLFEILSVENKMIRTVKVTKLPEENSAEESDDHKEESS